jgi:hypothetical protein
MKQYALDENGFPIEHEIDVHWEFELDGNRYKTIIQAKDWVHKIKKGQMIEFDGIVNDISSSDGIFIAKSGFQSGAISWARAKGIEAAELRVPTTQELQNRIQHIQVDFRIESLMLTNFTNIIPDETWLKSLSAEQLQSIRPQTIHPPSITVEREDGSQLSTLVQFAIDPKQCSGWTGTVTYDKECNPPVFLVGFGGLLNKVKIRKFTVTVEVTILKKCIEINGLLTHILRSVTGTENYFISKVNGELKVYPARELPNLINLRL